MNIIFIGAKLLINYQTINLSPPISVIQ